MPDSAGPLAFLLNAAWQVPLIALAAWAGARILRAGLSRWEHRLWVAALVAAVMLPAASLLPDREAPAKGPHAVAVRGGSSGDRELSIVGLPLPRPRIEAPGPRAGAMIIIVYALGVGVRAARLWPGWRRTRALRGASEGPVADPRVHAVAERCRSAFKLPAVPVVASRRIESPVTVGVLSPLVILPAAVVERLDEPALLGVLGHEMAHVRRRDVLKNLLYEVIHILLWFHPAAAFIRRGIARSREEACDEMVVETLVPRGRYARALLDAADLVARDRRPATLSLAALDRGLEARLVRLVSRRRSCNQAKLGAASCALFAAALLAGSALAPELHGSVSGGAARAAPDRSEPVSEEPLDGDLRAEAACRAGLLRDIGAIPELAGWLGDETPAAATNCYKGDWTPAMSTLVHPAVGEAAALALASIGPDSVPALTASLDAPSPVERRNAAWALGEVRGGPSVDRSIAFWPLTRMLADSDPTVRRAAAFASGEARNAGAAWPLIEGLDDADAGVRTMAAWALGEIRAIEAAPSLRRLVAWDPDDGARRAAAAALLEIEQAARR